MNIKLLKELYKQAETECGWSEEKFAELIVKECANTVKGYYGDELQLIHQAPLQILKHFGVKE